MTREIGYKCNIFITIQVIEKGITYLLYFTQINSGILYVTNLNGFKPIKIIRSILFVSNSVEMIFNLIIRIAAINARIKQGKWHWLIFYDVLCLLFFSFLNAGKECFDTILFQVLMHMYKHKGRVCARSYSIFCRMYLQMFTDMTRCPSMIWSMQFEMIRYVDFFH